MREHLSCRHYVSDYRCSFRYREDEAGSYFYFDDEPYNLMIFVLEGELTVTCNEFTNRVFKKGRDIFYPERLHRGEPLFPKERGDNVPLRCYQ